MKSPKTGAVEDLSLTTLGKVRSMKLPRQGTISHAAAVLNCTRPTVYAEIRAGRLRAFKLGTATRITPQALAEFIANQERDCPLVDVAMRPTVTA
jgi:excisionase family DNA binding protein